ncbi:hypothetical protein AeMF1_019385 [Aphanomyces euteiches]|nr:hypothetical protein AeMF1_019385 [Aphanomyces euteiches]KAH9167328.1 hypothetical protein AeNC1_018165 [Aphanomyces euteiches]
MITNSRSWTFQTPEAPEEMVTIQEEPAIHADFGQSVIPTDTQDIYQASEDTPRRKKRFVFKPEHDEKLILEVLGDNGIFNKSTTKVQAWTTIESNLRQFGIDASSHSLQFRLRLLYENHLEEEKKSKAASGVDEEVTEVKRLLTEYHEAVIDAKEEKKRKRAKVDAVDAANELGGAALREAHCVAWSRIKAKSQTKLTSILC